MNSDSARSALDLKLNRLWHELGHLNESQWTSLYQLVGEILRHSHFVELASLPEAKDDYIHAFFVEKILNREHSNGTVHAGFIQISFRNYLRDELRRPINRDQVQFDVPDDGQPDDGSRLEQLQQESSEGAASTAKLEQTLAEHGLRVEQVQDSAWQWLRAQEQWAQLYLVVHFCPDPQDLPPSLKSLAAKHRIAAYHYRARQLGITNKKTDLPSDYGKTAIGRWAIGLGIEIVSENISVLLCLFKCLCLATLSLEGDFD